MSQLRQFGDIISGNRQRCQDFTPEQRAFMLGAAAAGAKHSEIAEALNTKRQRVGEQIAKATKRQRLTSTPRKGSVAAYCVMITTAVCTARTRKRYAAKAQQIVLAAAVFDDRGRILVSPDGLLPSETITETFPQKSADDIFSTAHPFFHWMYRASRNWSNVATLLDWMRTHLNRLPSGGGRGMRSVKLVQENGQLVQNYDMIFRELFCIAASTLSYRLGEVLANAGALWDEIFVTVHHGRSPGLGPPSTGLSALMARMSACSQRPETPKPDTICSKRG
ncbi:hypothetical protein Micbo1qcDRAFT_237621 [Microdochium bolleyi]|uniref:Uncharacterized protein n=1 Tax=Microdochium bolleyi TaxID=196109 RepID=A0A136IJN3_9PEZI|nr:hypothetical protein Micbo1qcDRAFT_237621 [Microdochium bolleyi]